MKMSPELCERARGFLRWSRGELARRAGVSEPLVVKYEGGGSVRSQTVDKLAAAFSQEIVVLSETRTRQTITRARSTKGDE